MLNPPLSIVVPCHSRVDLLQLCLESISVHAPAHTEIIVVDDASPNEIVSQVALRFRSVSVIRLSCRRGFCVAANRGILAARGSVIELLNDDTQVTAGWADAALRCFVDPAVGAVAPLVLQVSDQSTVPIVDSAGDEFDPGGFYRKRGHGRRICAEFLQACDVFGASGSSAFYRRTALVRAGLFPEEFGAYFEDVDLSFRLNRAGWRVRFEPESRVWHRVGSSYRRRDRRLLERQSLNEERVFWRNTPGRALPRMIPRHLAVLGGKALLRCREGALMPFLMGRLRLLGEIAHLVKHRRWLNRLGQLLPADDAHSCR